MAASDRYDDYDDRAERPRSSPSGNKDLLLVFGIIGGVLLVVVLVCGGIGFYVIYSIRKAASQMQQSVLAKVEQVEKEQQRTEAAREFGQSFLQDLKNGETDTAYDNTSANYQKKTSLEKFKALVKQRQRVIEQQVTLQPDPNMNPLGPNSIYRFKEMILIHGEGFYNLVIAVTTEGDNWKVDQFSMTANTANDKAP
ncbi:MAG TPA: hypothetical protein VKS79_06325 [Gemmataceae bacterium]|nr:hypothetical protein [Gemmataceae bacterium]